MGAIEFGGNMNSEPATLQRSGRPFGVWSGRKKIAAHRKKNFCFAAFHGANRSNNVIAVFTRRRETKSSLERIEKTVRHSFRDAHRAVPLNIRMATHGADSGSRTADLPTHQMHVHDLLNCSNGISLLSEPHGPAGDHRS